MSRAGAMIDYVLDKIETVRPKAKREPNERVVANLGDEELPIYMVSALLWNGSLIEFKQRDETTTFEVAYVQDFQATEDPVRSLLDTAEAIVEEIWDGNAIDTDAAGFFAHVSAYDIRTSHENATRWALVMVIEVSTMDAVDSAFSLTERNL